MEAPFFVQKLPRPFRFCLLFCISPLSYNSFLEFDPSVSVSLYPDTFNPEKTCNLL